MSQVRLLAARIIDKVTAGASLNDCLDDAINTLPDSRDRAFVQAVTYGVCRYYSRLDVLLSDLLQKPMKSKDSDVHALMMVGLYQLTTMRLPAYAAVTETVNAAEKLKKKWAKGLINAVLRNYLRRQAELDAICESDEEALYAHPQWWISEFKQNWPNNYSEMLNANNQHPPMTLRVNTLHVSREDYLQRLNEQGIAANPILETSSGVMLSEPLSVEQLPGWSAGDVFVQDGAAQLAPQLMDLQPGQRVLDACAAPGGKLTHILELEANLAEVIAIEKDPKRVASIEANLRRLKLKADVKCADAGDLTAWWDGNPFDRILLDAPCSASGVIRRHPDIKLLRQQSDVAALAICQLRLLEALWQTLKPNGRLVYVTCSVFREENAAVILSFLKMHPEAKASAMDFSWGTPVEVGRQILPGQHQMDGFYYACLTKA